LGGWFACGDYSLKRFLEADLFPLTEHLADVLDALYGLYGLSSATSELLNVD
jgi:hypothetical protein